MYRITSIGIMGMLLLSSPAFALCTSYPNTLTNGTTADGGQVMANFNCAALTSGATLNGTTFSGTTTFPGSTVVSSTGDLGVGVSPAFHFDVGGSVAAGPLIGRVRNGSSTGYSSFRLYNDQNNLFRQVEFDYAGSAYSGSLVPGGPAGEAALISTSGAYPLVFGTSNSFAGMFASNGSFLVGTTTAGGWGANAKSEFYSATATVYALSAYGNGSPAAKFRVDSTSNSFANFFYTGTQVGGITTTGTATAYNTTSDGRLKTISQDQRNYRGAIEKLWVGDFSWKANNKSDFGVIAQQTYPLFPMAVSKPATEVGMWEVDYGKLAPLALWGVKDIYRLVDEQNRQLAALRQANASDVAEIASLKAARTTEATQIELLRTQMAELQHRVGTRTAQR